MSDYLVSVFLAFLILQILLDLGLFGLFVAVCARNRALEEQLAAENVSVRRGGLGVISILVQSRVTIGFDQSITC